MADVDGKDDYDDDDNELLNEGLCFRSRNLNTAKQSLWLTILMVWHWTWQMAQRKIQLRWRMLVSVDSFALFPFPFHTLQKPLLNI